MTVKNKKDNTAKKLRIKFVLLMMVSACIAGIILHTLDSGTSLFIPWVCICVISILTFLISGYGLLTNLLECLHESNKSKERES